jgi:hypothetical protein
MRVVLDRSGDIGSLKIGRNQGPPDGGFLPGFPLSPLRVVLKSLRNAALGDNLMLAAPPAKEKRGPRGGKRIQAKTNVTLNTLIGV